MTQILNRIRNIPTNLISGFLGVGKTSAVLHLMEQKPSNEKWSVLVNEFGAIGIDGAIYKSKGIDVKEIPGGCMCCAAGVPLQVAVNQILKQTRPQRLLIEPSGIGHPKRVMDTLQGEFFQEALTLRASICLIDPRNLSDSRYTTHENFIDQIALSDILVANKTDLCEPEELKQFHRFVDKLEPAKQKIIETQYGQLDRALLDLKPELKREAKFPLHHMHHKNTLNIKTTKEKDGYKSLSMSFNNALMFDFEKVKAVLLNTKKERVKAVMHTNRGWQIFNIQGNQHEITPLSIATESHLEIIAPDLNNDSDIALRKQLKQCEMSR